MLKCGLLGEKLGHSYSPAIHAMLADYEYLLYEKCPEELESFVRSGDWDGLNVTIPYKKNGSALLHRTVRHRPRHRQCQYPGAPGRRRDLRRQHGCLWF